MAIEFGHFGPSAPSLFVPRFSWHEYFPFATGSPPTDPNIPGNVNRVALLVSAPNAYSSLLSLRPPDTATRYHLVVTAQQTQVFTFIDLGALLSQPWYFFQTTDDGGTVIEVIYNPKGCK